MQRIPVGLSRAARHSLRLTSCAKSSIAGETIKDGSVGARQLRAMSTHVSQGAIKPVEDIAGTFTSTRADYNKCAMTDFVKDYRELCRLQMWDDLLSHTHANFRVLDVCAGTGRFSQAFIELVLRPRRYKVTHDYTDLCEHSLDVLEDRMKMLREPTNRVFACDAINLSSQVDEPYDLLVNMHGLYGIPLDKLSVALQAMYEVVKPGGHMVLSIGANDSLYQRIPVFLHRAGLIDTAYTNSNNIEENLKELGIEYTIEMITYYEEFHEDDREGLQRFLMDECGGNTFTTKDASQVCADSKISWDAVKPLMNIYLDPRTKMYNFKQEIAVFKIEKSTDVLPEILSANSFYADSYTLRRNASTMQSNMINWLKTQSSEKILSELPSDTGRVLRMLSIGCGDGELELSLMEGCKSKIGNTGQFTGVDFYGYEPIGEFHGTFSQYLNAGQAAGRLPSNVTSLLSDKAFDSEFELSPGTPRPDLIFMGHVLYYFGHIKDKTEVLRRAIQVADPNGRVVVIHQAAKGVPELQKVLLPSLRGTSKDMFTADDIEDLLNKELKDDIAGFARHDVDAYLDLSEVLRGTMKGIKIASFCLEADHRNANNATLKRSMAAFQQRSVQSAESGRLGGPFLAEPVVCFVIEPRK